jgi:hypothetical protein
MNVQVSSRDLLQARVLREAVYALVKAHVDRRTWPDEARRKVNRIIESPRRDRQRPNLRASSGFIAWGIQWSC